MCQRHYVCNRTCTVSFMTPAVAHSCTHTFWAFWICWPGGFPANTNLSTWLGGLSLSIKPKCSSSSLMNIPIPGEEGSCLKLSDLLSSSPPDEHTRNHMSQTHSSHLLLWPPCGTLSSVSHPTRCHWSAVLFRNDSIFKTPVSRLLLHKHNTRQNWEPCNNTVWI